MGDIEKKLLEAEQLNEEALRLKEEAQALCKHEGVTEYNEEEFGHFVPRLHKRVCNTCGISEQPYSYGKYQILRNPKHLRKIDL